MLMITIPVHILEDQNRIKSWSIRVGAWAH